MKKACGLTFTAYIGKLSIMQDNKLGQNLKVKNKIIIPIAIVLSTFIAPAYGQPEESAVIKLVEILEKSHSLQANVEQLELDQSGRELQQTLASLKMRKPDHFSWEMVEPYQELTVTNGRKVWRYEPDLDQVTIQNFEDDLNRTPVLLLNGDVESLQASYDITASYLPDGAQRFTLLPLSAGALFDRLSLTFVDTVLQEMQFEASSGQKTSLYFSDLETNISLDDAVFEFVIPADIDVIDTTLDY